MSKNNSIIYRALNWIETAGNALPQPAIMFLLLTIIVIVASGFFSAMGVEAIHPIKKEVITPVNLLSLAGLHLVLTEMVKNFSSFAPLGTVLVAMLGFSLAEKSGFLGALLRLLVLKSPRQFLVPAVLLAGVLSHTAGDIGYVLLIPLAGMAFHSIGLNPLAGIAICFAGVSGGFAANFLLSTADTLLSGLSQEAARIIDPNYIVTPVSNWYFMATSSILIIGIGTVVGNKITIPFLGKYTGNVESLAPERLNKTEKRGLTWAMVTVVILTLLLIAGILPEQGFLRDPKSFSVLESPLIKGIVAVIFIFGALSGLAYGFGAKTFKNGDDVTKAMTEAMATMAPYLVLVFFASQFISLFNASHMGLIMAVHGAEVLKQANMGTIPLMIGFIILTMMLDIVIGSASAKWALMAPVVVPMFMLLNLSPELSQAAYRVADSVVNIISPLMAYFPLILAFINKYDPKAKVGTLIALMLPYTVAFTIFWSVLLCLWILLDLPLGPGASLHYLIKH